MSKPVGCWCIWCGEYVKQEQMGHHVWMHGVAALGHPNPAVIGQCDLAAPAPWSKHQGYWDVAEWYEPFYKPTQQELFA